MTLAVLLAFGIGVALIVSRKVAYYSQQMLELERRIKIEHEEQRVAFNRHENLQILLASHVTTARFYEDAQMLEILDGLL